MTDPYAYVLFSFDESSDLLIRLAGLDELQAMLLDEGIQVWVRNNVSADLSARCVHASQLSPGERLHYDQEHDKQPDEGPIFHVDELRALLRDVLGMAERLRTNRNVYQSFENDSTNDTSEYSRGEGHVHTSIAKTSQQPNGLERLILRLLVEKGFTSKESIESKPTDRRPTQSWIAESLDRNCDSHLKTTLAKMVVIGWIDNGRNHALFSGYFVLVKGETLADQNLGQD